MPRRLPPLLRRGPGRVDEQAPNAARTSPSLTVTRRKFPQPEKTERIGCPDNRTVAQAALALREAAVLPPIKGPAGPHRGLPTANVHVSARPRDPVTDGPTMRGTAMISGKRVSAQAARLPLSNRL